MGKKKSNIDEKAAEVPLSSMIDVVFLLLIYFILTQKPVIEDVHLMVDLPAPGAPSKGEPPTLLTIDVHKLQMDNGDQIDALATKEGNAEKKKAIQSQEKIYYYMNSAPYESKQLREYLETVAKSNPNTTIMINCGPNAKHKKLVNLLDMCSELGLTKLNIVDDESVGFKADVPEKRD